MSLLTKNNSTCVMMRNLICELTLTDIEGTSATNGDGLYEGLSWLQNQLTTKQLKKSVSQPTSEVKDSITGFLSSCFSNNFTSKNTQLITQSQS